MQRIDLNIRLTRDSRQTATQRHPVTQLENFLNRNVLVAWHAVVVFPLDQMNPVV
jgi:hypothetical protein